jgi:WD40 repeat protein
VLVVDQFEELFTQCADEGQRRAFITALHTAASTGHGPGHTPAALVVLGVRADFESHCADHPQLASAIQDRYLVTAMTERQLRMAITEPAKKAGSRVDDDLVTTLLGEVHNGQPGIFAAGVLPLLSHALDQAWRSGTGQTLTLADYERAGGIEGAVAASAQRAYDNLTPAQQTAAQQVFTRLAATSTEGTDSADRATRADLTTGKTTAETQDVEAVLEAFAAERLLTLAAGTVELSHEILLTAWPLLRDTWLAETHADRITRTRLRQSAAEWDQHARDPSYLYTGSLLQAATGTAARISADPARHPPLGRAETDFLHASNRAHHRRARRRQGLLAVLIALVIGLASVAVLAARAGQQTAHERDEAVSGQLSSQSQLFGDANPVLAKLLAVAAWRINPSIGAHYAMLAAAALPGIRVLAGQARPEELPVGAVAFSPGGKTLATMNLEGTVRLWDVATGRPISSHFIGHGGPFDAVAFSPDGKTLAVVYPDSTVQLWDVATGRPIGGRLTGGTGIAGSVAFSPDGKAVATVSFQGTVRLWDVPSGQLVGPPFTGDTGTSNTGLVVSMAFSPDGKALATGSLDGTVQLWDLATHRPIGAPLTRGTGTAGAAGSVAFSPDGTTLATGSFDGPVQLWDVATDQPIGAPLTGSTGMVGSVAFSPDGKALATGSLDGTVRLWDVASGQLAGAPFTGDTGAVLSVAFSPDGKTLATGSDDGTVRLWDTASGRPIGAPLASGGIGDSLLLPGQGDAVAFSPDGKVLATVSIGGTVQLWEVATGRPTGIPFSRHAGSVIQVAFSPDGKVLATVSGGRKVRLWDVASSRPAGIAITNHAGSVAAVAFSPDGKVLATISLEGTVRVRLWEVATGSPIGSHLIGHGDGIYGVAFSPVGKVLATVSDDGTVRLWELATGRPIGSPLIAGTGTVGWVPWVVFSPDGKTLAVVYPDGTQLWQVATGRPIGSRLTGGTRFVGSVAFSPDGTIMAIGGVDGAVQLWDVATHRPIGSPLTGGGGVVESVAFSPDGKTLAVRSGNHATRLLDVAYLVAGARYLCASAGRSLTRAEWAHYVPGLAYERTCP